MLFYFFVVFVSPIINAINCIKCISKNKKFSLSTLGINNFFLFYYLKRSPSIKSQKCSKSLSLQIFNVIFSLEASSSAESLFICSLSFLVSYASDAYYSYILVRLRE